MIIGYAKISKLKDECEQNRIQINSLKNHGAEIIFQDIPENSEFDRPGLNSMLDNLNKDDLVLVWKLDKLSRSLVNLLTIIKTIEKRKAKFRSITQDAL